MSAEVNLENEWFIEQEVALGHFRDRSEALNVAVDLLRRQRETGDELSDDLEALAADLYPQGGAVR